MNQKLYLWKIYQNENNDYDTYSAAIVVAPDEESARNIHPSSQFTKGSPEENDLRSRPSSYVWSGTDIFGSKIGEWLWDDGTPGWCGAWTSPAHVKAILVGEALPGMIEGHVVCASFHAG